MTNLFSGPIPPLSLPNKVLQRLNAEILGHQRNVPRLDRPHDDTACGFTSLLSLWLHQFLPCERIGHGEVS